MDVRDNTLSSNGFGTMTMTIASNLFALQVNAAVRQNSNSLQDTLQRLASGSRINSLSDDAAGIGLRDVLRRDSAITSASLRNASDGLSAVELADSALEDIEGVLSRLGEIASQSASTSITTEQRSALAVEFNALKGEVSRITNSTRFNNKNLLQGDTLSVNINGTNITLSGVSSTLNALGLGTSGGTFSYSITGNSAGAAITSSHNAETAINNAIAAVQHDQGLVAATESRLSGAITNLTKARDNLEVAQSRITDINAAHETANYIRQQVIANAGTAIAAQANLQPRNVLQLFDSISVGSSSGGGIKVGLK